MLQTTTEYEQVCLRDMNAQASSNGDRQARGYL